MSQDIVDEAVEVVTDAYRDGIVIRLLGSLGVRMHCPAVQEVHDRLGRNIKDIDVICAKRDRNKLRDFLEGRGYEVDRDLLIAMEGTRYVFRHVELGIEMDVFVDDLDFNHVVPLRGRLEEHALSIPLEELVLHKLQIVQPTSGDHQDLFALLSVHDVGASGDGEVIDTSFIAGVLARDWGFHRTATANLRRFRSLVPRLEDVLDVEPVADATREKLDRRAHALQQAIAAEPKTLRWRLRAKVGTRMQWWQDVDDPRDTY